MTGRERMQAAFRGEEVDRVPIWLREGFPVLDGPAGADHFQRGWQQDPLYRELFDFVAPHVDSMARWDFPSSNRHLMIPSRYIRTETVFEDPGRKRYRRIIETPRGLLEDIIEVRRGQDTMWHVRAAVQSWADLEKLAAVPFEIHPGEIEAAQQRYRAVQAQYGSKAILRTALSSPIVCLSGAMPLQLFLEGTYTHKKRFQALCEEVTERILALCAAFFTADREWDTTVTIGGSEQCTPPLMHPRAYDDYVVPYEGRLIDFLTRRGIPVQLHCHGQVGYALPRMVEMGAAATDPVEPPPAGDVTYEQARAIVGDQLTLIGNLEFDRLERGAPAEIREQVRQLCSQGKRRLILGASAGPLSAVSQKLADNYQAFVEAGLEFGR